VKIGKELPEKLYMLAGN